MIFVTCLFLPLILTQLDLGVLIPRKGQSCFLGHNENFLVGQLEIYTTADLHMLASFRSANQWLVGCFEFIICSVSCKIQLKKPTKCDPDTLGDKLEIEDYILSSDYHHVESSVVSFSPDRYSRWVTASCVGICNRLSLKCEVLQFNTCGKLQSKWSNTQTFNIKHAKIVSQSFLKPV